MQICQHHWEGRFPTCLFTAYLCDRLKTCPPSYSVFTPSAGFIVATRQL